MEDDKLHEECGLFGVFGHPEAANMTYLGLYSLQHRGQESTGIVSSDGRELHAEISMGLVADAFTRDRLERLPGKLSIGHNRYSTTGSSLIKNAQPILVSYSQGSLALAHNGNLTNAAKIRQELVEKGSIFSSTTDSEVIIHLIATSSEVGLVSRLIEALHRVEGAYCLLVLSKDQLIAVRDPSGFRPLSLGRIDNGWVLTSETCSLDLIDAQFVRDVEPGEILIIDHNGVDSLYPFPSKKRSYCVFELIYFARPDSNVFGQNVHLVRKTMGRNLAQEFPVDADLVIPVPDSGVPAALGYAEASTIPFDMGLIRNHYIGRTFIEPQQSIRHFGVKVKLNANKQLLQGKRVIIVDDSIVRGTTSRKIVQMVRKAGAREVHVRISSPPKTHPCFYGIDTPTKGELIAANHSVEEICRYLTADSLAYLSFKGLTQAIETPTEDFCYACFNGRYPTLESRSEDIREENLQTREANINSLL